jgi:hypothetical protein
VVLVLAGAVVVSWLEQTNADVRRWAVEHPITVALVAGLVLLALTVLGVERFLSLMESRRWRDPGREAINTWLFAADEAIRNIGLGVERAAESLALPPAPGSKLRDFLPALAEQDPDALRDVSDLVRREAGHVGITAMTAVSIVARYTPLGGVARMMFDAQRHFDEVADICRHLAWTNPLLLGEHRVKVLPLAVDAAEKVSRLLSEINDDLVHLRLYVMQTRDRLPHSAGIE